MFLVYIVYFEWSVCAKFVVAQCLFYTYICYFCEAFSFAIGSVQIVLTNQVTHKVTNEGSKMVPALGVKHLLFFCEGSVTDSRISWEEKWKMMST